MIATHPRHHLDELLLNPIRLSILAALVEVDRAEFALVRDAVDITSSALSKQVARLEAAGYLAVEKGRVGRLPCTWLRATPAGTSTLRRHVLTLNIIAVPATDTVDPITPEEDR